MGTILSARHHMNPSHTQMLSVSDLLRCRPSEYALASMLHLFYDGRAYLSECLCFCLGWASSKNPYLYDPTRRKDAKQAFFVGNAYSRVLRGFTTGAPGLALTPEKDRLCSTLVLRAQRHKFYFGPRLKLLPDGDIMDANKWTTDSHNHGFLECSEPTHKHYQPPPTRS